MFSNDRVHLPRSSEDQWVTHGVMVLLECRDGRFDLFHFLTWVCRAHCETSHEYLGIKHMLRCSWRTKSQPAVWHLWENQSRNPNVRYRLKCQPQTSKGLFITSEANESQNKIFLKYEKTRPQVNIYSSLLTAKNLTGVSFSAAPTPVNYLKQRGFQSFIRKAALPELFLFLISTFCFPSYWVTHLTSFPPSYSFRVPTVLQLFFMGIYHNYEVCVL